MTPEEAAAIRSREGKETAVSVAHRYGVEMNTVLGLWKGFARPGSNGNGLEDPAPASTLEVPQTAKGRIRKRMEETGHTYESLAEEIGITFQSVGQIVSGRTTGATARYSLARALDRWPEDFWWDDQRETP